MGSTGEISVTTDFLIAGAGPAGASLACFLSRDPYNLTGIMISNQPTTSQQPRAHITNPAALECLRDIGLDEECCARATTGENMLHTRWCHSMTGEEYARIPSWGNDPDRKGDYEGATPCSHVDLPQTEFEPIICRRAAEEGWQVRFSTTFLTFYKDSSTEPSDCRQHCSRRSDQTRVYDSLAVSIWCRRCSQSSYSHSRHSHDQETWSRPCSQCSC